MIATRTEAPNRNGQRRDHLLFENGNLTRECFYKADLKQISYTKLLLLFFQLATDFKTECHMLKQKVENEFT